MKTLRFGLLAVAVLAFAGCSKVKPQPPAAAKKTQGATATPTMTTIGIDGTYADWQQVLLNPLQVSGDGNSISGSGCYPTNSDRDCEAFTPQRDVTRFAWTYDDASIYTYLERPTSNATLTYSFVMDTNADGLADTTDKVLQVEWKAGGRAVGVRLFEYVPENPAGDPMACPDATLCGPHGQVGFVDGYTMPGTTGSRLWAPGVPSPGCPGGADGDQCGGDGIGTRFEVAVPWAGLGVAPRSPIFWHVASSTTAEFNHAKDNVGGPDGKMGTFGVFGVDFTEDQFGSMPSPGSVDYCHRVQNTGEFADAYELSATSSTGAQISFFTDLGGCVAGTPLPDSNGDGRPDTGELAGGAVRTLIIRLRAGSGLDGSTDRLVATARSVARPTVVVDTVTDHTRIGQVTVIPDFSLTGSPGVTVDVGPHLVQNNESVADTFELFVRSSQGYSISLHESAGSGPGAFLARDSNGDGVWDSAVPGTGPIATGGTRAFWLRVTVPGSAALGTLESIELRATSATRPAVSGAALDTLAVLGGLTISPSYTAPSSQLMGTAGTSVYLPHVVINSLAVPNTVTLVQSGVAPGYTMKWWSDPNGDGNISDGQPITSLTLAPFGGTQNLVTELTIPASGVPSSSPARTTVNGVAGSSAFANDNVAVGSLQTYGDVLFTQPSRYFQACGTIYAKGVGLTPLQTTNYQLRFSNPSAAIVQSENLPTDNVGQGTGTYALKAADGPGDWRVQIFSGATQIYDFSPVVIERSGTVALTGPATAANNQPLALSALLTNTAIQVDYTGTQVTFALTDAAGGVLQTSTVSAIDLQLGRSFNAFVTWPNVNFPAYGSYTATAEWKTSCGSTIATASTVVDRVPQAPTLSTPPDGALIATLAPMLTGAAVAGATVNIYLDGVLSGIATGVAPFGFSTPALSPGLHTWYATATVGALTSPPSVTFTFMIDTQPPAAPVLVSPANGSVLTTATPRYAGTAQPGTLVSVRVDGVMACAVLADAAGAWICNQPAPLAEGPHSVDAIATNAAGSHSAASPRNSFAIDTVAPDTVIVSGPPAVSRSSAALFDVSSPDTQATFECRLDGDPAGFTACGDPQSFAGLFEGGHTLEVRARDAAGNVDLTPASASWTVDTVAPDTRITSAPPAEIYVSTAGFDFSSDDPNATFECSLDARAFAVCSRPAIFNGLTVGSHTFGVRAKDAAGNVDPTPATRGWVVIEDLDTVIVSGPPLLTNNPSGTFDFFSPAANVSYECSLDGVAFAACGNPVTFHALSEGSHTLRARAKDAGGNFDPTPARYAWTVDTLPPAMPRIASPVERERVGFNPPIIQGTAEAGSTVILVLDSGVLGSATADANGNWSFTPAAPISTGAHTLSATARDAAGNTSPATPPLAFILDPSALDTRFVSGPLGPTPSTTAIFIVESNRAGATFECNLDGVGYWACANPITLPDQGPGPHSLQVRARDGSEVDSTPATRAWSVDLTAPLAPVVILPADGSTVGTDTPEVRGTAEPLSLVTVLIDGNAVGAVAADVRGSWSVTPTQALTPGTHTASARAVDAAGNGSPASAVNRFTVDLTTLDTFIVSGPNPISAHDSAAFDLASNLPNVTFECSLDGVAFSPCSDPVTFTALADGRHELLARARGWAGDVDSTPAGFVWSIDTGRPQVPVVITPADGSTQQTNRPLVSGLAEPAATVRIRIDGNGVDWTTATAAGTWALELSAALTEGGHFVDVIATDVAGNASLPSNTNAFTVVTVVVTGKAPAPTILDPQNGALLNDSTPTIVGKAAPRSTVTVRFDAGAVGTAVADASGDWTFMPGQAIGDGLHAITATASLGNGESEPSAPTMITIDTVAPQTVIIRGPQAETMAAIVEFEFGADEPVASFELSLDDGPFTRVGSPASTPELAPGQHKIVVRATDLAGNVDPSPQGYGWQRLSAIVPVPVPVVAKRGCGCASVDPAALFALVGLVSLISRRSRRPS